MILEKCFSSIAENESDSPKLTRKQGRFLFFLRFFPNPHPPQFLSTSLVINHKAVLPK